MKRIILVLVLLLLFSVDILSAQSVFLKKDTIVAGKTNYALFKKGNTQPLEYFVYNLKGVELLEMHCGRIEINGKPGYVVNFLNDMKQAMITKDAGFPSTFIKEIVSRQLIVGNMIDKESELKFIAANPLPVGYTDVEQLIEFDGYKSIK